MRVKICGITTPGDAVLAAELGASAIGLVFWPGSPRCIDAARAREIVKALPPFVSAFGVFVNQVVAIQGGQEIDPAHHCVSPGPGLDHTGPGNDERHANTRLVAVPLTKWPLSAVIAAHEE